MPTEDYNGPYIWAAEATIAILRYNWEEMRAGR